MLQDLLNIITHAWKIITDIKKQGIELTMKSDTWTWADYLTQADLAADEYISWSLRTLFPDDIILTEETAEKKTVDWSKHVRIVDPIDGTKNYATWSDTYGILIWRCTNWIPDIGMSYFPEKEILIYTLPWQGVICNDQEIHGSGSLSKRPSIVSWPHLIWCTFEAWTYTNRHNETLIWQKAYSCTWWTLCQIVRENISASWWHVKRWKRDICAWHALLNKLWYLLTDRFWDKIDYQNDSPFILKWYCAWSKEFHKRLQHFMRE